ncbi:hypothetical protein ABI060_14475, partial [Enterococcus faecium]|uniref:hypothetical protein n=1 Tax=Enterococcus faecium TaxID=1352 RepID=UPI003F435F77
RPAAVFTIAARPLPRAGALCRYNARMTLTFPMPAESESAPLVRPERIGMLLAGSDPQGQQRIDVEAVAETGSTNVDLMQRLSSLQR